MTPYTLSNWFDVVFECESENGRRIEKMTHAEPEDGCMHVDR